MASAFVDTNILIETNFSFDDYEKIYIAGIVLEELDNLKTDKDKQKAFKSRKAIKYIYENIEKVKIITDYSASVPFLDKKNDNYIISAGKLVKTIDSDCVFFSNDIEVILKGLQVGIDFKMYEICKKNEIYKGYIEVKFESQQEMADHYEHPTNKWDLKVNQYIAFYDENDKLIDLQRWTATGFVPLDSKGFKSMALGKVDPKKGDIQQAFAFDSLNRLQFTLLTGAAGTGKTLFAISWAMQALQSGKIGRIVVAFSPQPLKNAREIGFLPGSKDQKLLDGSLGGILASKLGDMSQVTMMIAQGRLHLIPVSDIRGFETQDDDFLFVTEAQNCSDYILKTVLQRAKDGTKIVIEGDVLEQTDMKSCSFEENGMVRAIEAFAGEEVFGCVKLKNIYRSRVANIAQKM